MTDKKLTDNEIIKALKCCGRESCFGCPYRGKCHQGNPMIKNALDLITRQKTENENLKVENQSLRTAGNSLKMHYEEAQAEIERLKEFIVETRRCDKEIKAEAYKEFAERLKTEYAKGMSWFKKKESYYVDVGDIDNLVKEVIGE